MAEAKSERAEELAALYEISSAILSTLDVDAVLQRVDSTAPFPDALAKKQFRDRP